MSPRGNTMDYSELVHHVLRDAHTPLTLDEIVRAIQELEPIHVANPKALVLNILEQSSLILPVEGKRYGYLPHLLQENAFRQPLTAAARRQGFVELSPDALTALWPGWVEAQRQQEARPAELALPNGTQALLRRHFRLVGHWGFTASSDFWNWLEEINALPGDDFIIRVIDADARNYAGSLECQDCRDEEAVARRNREVADLAVEAVRAAGGEILADRLAPLLVAAGAYQNPLPPDPLITVLAQDGRFIDAGLGMVALAEGWTEADERLADQRQRTMWEAVGAVRPRFRRASPEPDLAQEDRSTFARLVMEGRLEEAVDWLQRENRIHIDEQGEVVVNLEGLLEDLPGTSEETERGG